MLSQDLLAKSIAYVNVHTQLNLGIRHESVLAYLPGHMQCEILLTQHRYCARYPGGRD